MSPIVLADGRNPDEFLFLSWDNDTSGHVGSGSGAPVCSSSQSIHIAEVKSNDADYYGSYVSFHKDFFR